MLETAPRVETWNHGGLYAETWREWRGRGWLWTVRDRDGVLVERGDANSLEAARAAVEAVLFAGVH